MCNSIKFEGRKTCDQSISTQQEKRASSQTKSKNESIKNTTHGKEKRKQERKKMKDRWLRGRVT